MTVVLTRAGPLKIVNAGKCICEIKKIEFFAEDAKCHKRHFDYLQSPDQSLRPVTMQLYLQCQSHVLQDHAQVSYRQVFGKRAVQSSVLRAPCTIMVTYVKESSNKTCMHLKRFDIGLPLNKLQTLTSQLKYPRPQTFHAILYVIKPLYTLTVNCIEEECKVIFSGAHPV